MLAAQIADRADDGEPASDGLRTKSSAVAGAAGQGRGHGGEAMREPAERLVSRGPRRPPLEVARDQRDQQEDGDHDAGDPGRDDRQARRAGPCSTPVRSRMPLMMTSASR